MFVTGSDDRTAIVWDLNRLRYMRQLSGHEGPVVYTAVHPYWGEIVTVDETSKGSNIYLWTVNGEKVCFFAAPLNNGVGITAITFHCL
jgi:WD40 repeat protein